MRDRLGFVTASGTLMSERYVRARTYELDSLGNLVVAVCSGVVFFFVVVGIAMKLVDNVVFHE